MNGLHKIEQANVNLLNGKRNKSKKIFTKLPKMEDIIFGLEESNVEDSVYSTLKLLNDDRNIITYNYDTIHLLYVSFYQRCIDPKIYIDYLLLLNQKEEESIEFHFNSILNLFIIFLHHKKKTKVSNFLLEYMFEHGIVDPKIVHYTKEFYFAHWRLDQNKCWPNYDCKNLKKNDWELHKTLIHERFTRNEIMQIIRNDDVENLQEISSQSNFDFKQTISYSYYDLYFNELNKSKDITLIDYAAFFGSIKCFKFLLMNGATVNNAGKYAIASGNEEIIHLCEQNHSSFEDGYETAIEYHRNDIFNYLYENKIIEIIDITNLGIKCVECYNYQILSFLEKNGMKINDAFIKKLAENGNLFLMKHYIKKIEISKDIFISSTTSGNLELVKYIYRYILQQTIFYIDETTGIFINIL